MQNVKFHTQCNFFDFQSNLKITNKLRILRVKRVRDEKVSWFHELQFSHYFVDWIGFFGFQTSKIIERFPEHCFKCKIHSVLFKAHDYVQIKCGHILFCYILTERDFFICTNIKLFMLQNNFNVVLISQNTVQWMSDLWFILLLLSNMI